uniref:HTH_48 domain-containing protein n=1 Tax=Globodera pallida TaxID=36090 RepID=A0A183CCK6_GLOPA
MIREKGHAVNDCWTLQTWVKRASALGRKVDFERVVARDSTYCFACLHEGIRTSCLFGDWREGWLNYRTENHP